MKDRCEGICEYGRNFYGSGKCHPHRVPISQNCLTGGVYCLCDIDNGAEECRQELFGIPDSIFFKEIDDLLEKFYLLTRATSFATMLVLANLLSMSWM